MYIFFSLASFRIIPDTIIKLPHGMRPDEDERSDDEDNSTSPTSPTSGMNKFVNEYLLLRAGWSRYKWVSGKIVKIVKNL